MWPHFVKLGISIVSSLDDLLASVAELTKPLAKQQKRPEVIRPVYPNQGRNSIFRVWLTNNERFRDRSVPTSEIHFYGVKPKQSVSAFGGVAIIHPHPETVQCSHGDYCFESGYMPMEGSSPEFVRAFFKKMGAYYETKDLPDYILRLLGYPDRDDSA